MTHDSICSADSHTYLNPLDIRLQAIDLIPWPSCSPLATAPSIPPICAASSGAAAPDLFVLLSPSPAKNLPSISSVGLKPTPVLRYPRSILGCLPNLFVFCSTLRDLSVVSPLVPFMLSDRYCYYPATVSPFSLAHRLRCFVFVAVQILLTTLTDLLTCDASRWTRYRIRTLYA